MTSPPFFVAGMSRAGTNWLAKCLNEHPDSAVFGETAFWGRYFVEPGPEGRYTKEQMRSIIDRLKTTTVQAFGTRGPGSLKQVSSDNIPALLDETFGDGTEPLTPEEVFERVAETIARVEGKRYVIEKTPHHVNWVRRILDHLPRAKLVVLAREPYGFMLSYKHQGDRKPPRIKESFEKLYHPLVCGWIWRTYAKNCYAAAQRYPGRVHLVRFEDIEDKPAAVIQDVERFLGLSPLDLSSKVPPDNSSFPSEPRPCLRSEDIFWMNLVARKEMKKHGYPIRPTPFAPLAVAGSILELPYWAIRNVASLRDNVSGSLWRYIRQWLRSSMSI
jgi:hypothetical protein